MFNYVFIHCLSESTCIICQYAKSNPTTTENQENKNKENTHKKDKQSKFKYAMDWKYQFTYNNIPKLLAHLIEVTIKLKMYECFEGHTEWRTTYCGFMVILWHWPLPFDHSWYWGHRRCRLWSCWGKAKTINSVLIIDEKIKFSKLFCLQFEEGNL